MLEVKGGIKMNPSEEVTEVVTADVEVEVVRTEEAPSAPEPEKSFWEEKGFEKQIATICTDLEAEPEKFLFDANVRHVLDTVLNATKVEDFDRFTRDEINNFIDILRNQVPRIERQVVSFIAELTRARAVKVDTIDFI